MNHIKTFFICFISAIIILNSHSQVDSKNIVAGGMELNMSTADTSINEIFLMIGEAPIYPGGMDNLISYAKSYLFYPETAIRDSIEGKVKVHFTVDTSGKVVDEKILKSVRIDLDTLCLSMVRHMSNWKAGQLNGKAIAVSFSWSINFVILINEDKKKAQRHKKRYKTLRG